MNRVVKLTTDFVHTFFHIFIIKSSRKRRFNAVAPIRCSLNYDDKQLSKSTPLILYILS